MNNTTQPQTDETLPPGYGEEIERLVDNFIDKFNHDFDNGAGWVDEELSTMEDSLTWMLKVFATTIASHTREEVLREVVEGINENQCHRCEEWGNTNSCLCGIKNAYREQVLELIKKMRV